MKRYPLVKAVFCVVLFTGLTSLALAADKKVKVFILAGQSNMEGHGMLGSLDHLGNHPKYGHLLKKLKNRDGSWVTRDDVTIYWNKESKKKKHGPLTVGWGSEEHEIGPELMFGTIMGDKYDEPVLLIKTAWGGKSVWCDFRSPGAGEMTWDEKRILKRDHWLKPGYFYRKMVAEIKECLANIKDVVWGYKGQGYEIVGMAWFQGWNDFGEWHLQLDGKRVGLGLIERYPHNLASMFRDLRKELDVPDMPIVIGELGVGGHEMTKRAEKPDDHEAVAMVKFRKAQKAVADDPSLKNITFVPTADFWDIRLQELRRQADAYWNEKQKQKIKDTDDNVLPTKELNAEYWRLGGHWYCHYNGSATNYSLVGYALAQALNTGSGLAQATDDILMADFEGADYQGWTPEGVAFGPAPAQGTLSHQGPVSGYKGKGLVNSFLRGDSSKGTLTSPEFTIKRKYMSFLVGGGHHEGEACMNLLIDGKVVRSHTGPNDEYMRGAGFDVSEFMGQKATLRIIDMVEGNWGHINIDHIVLTDQKPDCVLKTEAPDLSKAFQTREITIEKQYLLFPISGAPSCNVVVSIEGRSVRIFDASLATDRDHIYYWSYTDMSEYHGKTGNIRVKNLSKEGFKLIRQSDTIPAKQEFYTERLRPQFHFTPKVGWCNDSNGLVYYDGEWHLFFQHNPYGTGWGNMHWGHAVSPDLLHWEQLPNALYPWSMARSNCFSGSAAVDWNNTSGFQTGKERPLVIAFTDMGCGESLAYSNDRGRTWTYYDGNPLFEHRGRDPKITWHKPTQQWVIAVFDETIPELGGTVAFYTSKDMKNWQFQSRLKGYHECIEVFELPVDGDLSNTRWVIFGGDARYALGSFNGKTFKPEHVDKHQVHYGAYYASQVFNDAPGNRKVQIGWAKIDMPGMPFNQVQSFPCELSLRTTENGIRMFAEPVKEIEKIYKKKGSARKKSLAQDKPVRLDVSGDIFDITATFEPGDATMLGLDIGGNRIEYNVEGNRLQDAPLKPVDGKVTIRVLIDRPMMEIIGNNGRVYITRPREKKGDVKIVEAFAIGGTAKLIKIEVNELKSIWKK